VAVPRSPVPQDVSVELGRVVERWHQLPLGHAISCAPAVRAVIDALAGEPVPDLGPSVLMDQLTVMVHDACRDAVATGRPAGFADQLAGRLTALRRTL